VANFLIAYNLTMAKEGGYVDDSDDLGGETYRGISRRYHPNWIGWEKIDFKKGEMDDDHFSKNLNPYSSLQDDVKEFYKEQFWNIFLGDEILSQGIADELFDIGVNMHPIKAVTFLQEALNVMNRNGRLYLDIVVDGVLGVDTLDTLVTYMEKDDVSYLVQIMNILQGAYYIKRMKESLTQEKYARGWLDRVVIEKL